MIQWFKELDDVLRGRKADAHLLATGTAHIRIKPLVLASILLGAAYGVFMGLFALTRTHPSVAQLFASTVKVPLLFVLTLVVTFPSLYVFSALLGVRLGPKDMLRLILAPIAVNLAVLASLGPITGFFTLSTSSYPFMKLLNFLFFAISGVIGLKVLLTMLSRLEAAQAATPPIPSEPEADQPSDGAEPSKYAKVISAAAASASAPQSGLAQTTFRVWLAIYALVGAQMGWVLRPFIGDPDLPFQMFRAREANIFVDVVRTLGDLLGR